MNRKNEIMTVRGFDTTCASPIDLQQEQPFSDSTTGKHFGMPITPSAFCEMLGRFRNSSTAQGQTFKDLWWVQFSKASLFRVLAQEECDYVRFYFAIPDADEKKASLCLQGIDSNGKTIKRGVLEDVSKKMTDPVFNPSGKLDEPALLNSLSTRPPSTEEKGNGGHGTSLTGDKNLKSIGDFYQWQKDNGKPHMDMDLATFIKDFLEYADM